jgi:CspA family cold shock protein
MNTGKVKFFNSEKGYGFIKDDETGQDYFIHVTGLIDEVQEDDAVTYEVTEGKKGLQAVDVKRA